MATEHSTTTITGGHANAVSGGAAGFMTGADKAKLDLVQGGAMSLAWGAVAAPATTSGRFFLRTGAAVAASSLTGTYPCAVSGSRTVYLTWNVSGTPLVTDAITLTLYINGVASALVATMGAGATGGQASATISLSAGDALAIRLVQSSTEAQAAWHGSAIVTT